MAKYFNTKQILSGQSEHEMGHSVDEGTTIKVFYEEESDANAFLDDPLIQKDGRISVFAIPKIEGGGAGMPSLIVVLYSAVVISIFLMSKGFLDEMGRELARAIIGKLKGLKKPGSIHISINDLSYEIEALIPSGMNKEDCDIFTEKLGEYLEGLKSPEVLTKIYLTFDRETGRLIVISNLPK